MALPATITFTIDNEAEWQALATMCESGYEVVREACADGSGESTPAQDKAYEVSQQVVNAR